MPNSDLRQIAPGLELTERGWWSSPTVSGIDYPSEGNSVCFAVEDSSFWFQHRNRCIVEILRHFPPAGPLFDIGGGNGCVARAIQEAGHEVVLIEPGLTGVENALRRGLRQVVRATLQDLGALPASVPAAAFFDVVEHIPDDAGFLTETHRFLAPGGRIYLTVPAYNWLWSHEDIIAGHSRRYTVASLRRLLEGSGYKVEFATYFFGFLPIPILMTRVLPYRLGLASTVPSAIKAQAEHSPRIPLASRAIEMLSRRELRRLAAGQPLTSGGSCLVVARKA